MKRKIPTSLFYATENDCQHDRELIVKRIKIQKSQKIERFSLESLILAGEALSKDPSPLREVDVPSLVLNRITPKEAATNNESTSRERIQESITKALREVKCKVPPVTTRMNRRDEKSTSPPMKEWMKICRPLGVPPRLPNLPSGIIFQTRI